MRLHRDDGFALILTLTLLAMLVVCVLALGTLGRVGGQISTQGVYQLQARQNALLGLSLALGRLQESAGPDACSTGTGGAGGVAAGSRFRQWCGVWPANGSGNPIWLASGAGSGPFPALVPARPVVRLVGPGSTGTEGIDREYVEVGKEPVMASGDSPGDVLPAGNYAWWVGDEGAKVSAIITDAEIQISPSGRPLRPDFRRLLSPSFVPGAAANVRALTFEQLNLTAGSVSLTAAFHQLTRTSLALTSTAASGVPRPGDYVAGAFNINTTSEAAWRALLEFPDAGNSRWGLTTSRTLSTARGIRDRLTARGRPFASVAELADSNLIQAAFDHASPKVTTVTQEQFLAELAPILTVRSDTFRIRAYGDAVNPADAGPPEAAAWCEAIVQRTPDPAPGGSGRKFIVTFFRWLGPDDI